VLTKKEASDAFISIIYDDAFDIGGVIIKELQELGSNPSLENEICRNVFTAEWFVARLMWLELKAKGILDPEMKAIFVQGIKEAVTEVIRNIPDLGQVKADYGPTGACHRSKEPPRPPPRHNFGTGHHISTNAPGRRASRRRLR
jgi:hypothetical protein